MRVVEPTNPDFPERLRLPARSPLRLYVRGDLGLCRAPTIAIVGARDASHEAVDFTSRLAKAATALGLVVVSGAARGIDAAAHQGAMAAGGLTVAIFAEPLDHMRQWELAGDILLARGCLLSENPPGGSVQKWQFLERNRLIAALADRVLVVRARGKSGALSTAEWARQYGRPVWAVPGGPWDERAVGVNRLIAGGALPICSVADFVRRVSQALGRPAPIATKPRDPFLAALARGPLDPSALALRVGVSVVELGRAILEHELEGAVLRLSDGRFALAAAHWADEAEADGV